jgi:hypothetical protein
MSRKLEVGLAWLGGLLALLAVLFLVGYLAQKVWRQNAEVETAEKAVAARQAAFLEKLRADGVVLSELPERETLFVDAARWRALTQTERNTACAAAAERFDSKRCFVDNAADASRVGLYWKSEGYRAREDATKPH